MGANGQHMKFLGRSELSSFMLSHPINAESVRAWVREIQNCVWRNLDALAADFQNVEAGEPPRAVFQFGQPPLRIETLIDFRNGIVLLTGIGTADLPTKNGLPNR